MSLRLEFVTLAQQEGANISELCRRFEISRDIGYKWLERFRVEGAAGLEDRSRRPHASPGRMAEAMSQRILELRAAHPAWGPRKLRRRLADLGVSGLPAPSTINALLRRSGCIDEAYRPAVPYVRFERPQPNELWQMDFKGHVAMSRGERCHPLTLLDDHARYLLGLRACARENGPTVQAHLAAIFARYGLPESLLCDNAPPWSGSGGEWTPLAIWLIRLGIRVLHGRPYHPQTQGKEERFHRTLQTEVLSRTDLHDLPHSQKVFDRWRPIYNHERPHEALGLATPASRYRPSARSLPKVLAPIEYSPGDHIFTVKGKGEITWKNRTYYLGNGFAKQLIALRPNASDGLYEVFFCHQRLGWIDLQQPPAKSKHHYLNLLKTKP